MNNCTWRRRVSHSLCMCVVGHGLVGLVRAGIEVVDGMHVGQSQWGVGHMPGDAVAFPK